MTPTELLNYYSKGSDGIIRGAQARASRGSGFTRQAINKWVEADEIPFDAQCRIEIMTSGALKADRDPIKEIKEAENRCNSCGQKLKTDAHK